MRKILYLQWDCFCEEYICASFQRAGIKVEKYAIPYGKVSMREDEIFEQELSGKIGEDDYEFIFSFNFFPAVARVCHNLNQRYISWTYDSPFMFLYAKEVQYETNTVYIFDKAVVESLRQKGVHTVYYLPMAAPVHFYDSFFSSAGVRKQYGSDISFVGSTYTEQRQNFMGLLDGLDEPVHSYLEMLMQMQLSSYAVPVLEQFLNDQAVTALQQVCPIALEEGELQSLSWMYANYFLAREVTARERTQIIERLSDVGAFKLYTPEATPNLIKTVNMGPVDYCNQMPYVFKNSKINLNISLKSIYSGIPLRAFDIMGCGGFLLSDFQPDFGELFVQEEDYCFYTTIEDCIARTQYYLEHEDERIRTARNGYEKVKEFHTYDNRVKKMLESL